MFKTIAFFLLISIGYVYSQEEDVKIKTLQSMGFTNINRLSGIPEKLQMTLIASAIRIDGEITTSKVEEMLLVNLQRMS